MPPVTVNALFSASKDNRLPETGLRILVTISQSHTSRRRWNSGAEYTRDSATGRAHAHAPAHALTRRRERFINIYRSIVFGRDRSRCRNCVREPRCASDCATRTNRRHAPPSRRVMKLRNSMFRDSCGNANTANECHNNSWKGRAVRLPKARRSNCTPSKKLLLMLRYEELVTLTPDLRIWSRLVCFGNYVRA